MKLKVYTEPPQGQFIAIWWYNEQLWASAYRLEDDNLYRYNDDIGVYEKTHEFSFYKPINFVFLKMEE